MSVLGLGLVFYLGCSGGGSDTFSSESISFSSSCDGVTAREGEALLKILWDGTSSSAMNFGGLFFLSR